MARRAVDLSTTQDEFLQIMNLHVGNQQILFLNMLVCGIIVFKAPHRGKWELYHSITSGVPMHALYVIVHIDQYVVTVNLTDVAGGVSSRLVFQPPAGGV